MRRWFSGRIINGDDDADVYHLISQVNVFKHGCRPYSTHRFNLAVVSARRSDTSSMNILSVPTAIFCIVCNSRSPEIRTYCKLLWIKASAQCECRGGEAIHWRRQPIRIKHRHDSVSSGPLMSCAGSYPPHVLLMDASHCSGKLFWSSSDSLGSRYRRPH